MSHTPTGRGYRSAHAKMNIILKASSTKRGADEAAGEATVATTGEPLMREAAALAGDAVHMAATALEAAEATEATRIPGRENHFRVHA